MSGLGVWRWRGRLEAAPALLASSLLRRALFSPDLPARAANDVISFPGSFLPERVALVSFAAEEEES